MSDFINITEYIEGFEGVQKKQLKNIYSIIKKAVPNDAKETINYRMPTFRYHGNLIHFAMFKNHLGIYPGVEAIIRFERELERYKTSKGAIQIPLDAAIPEKLIVDIVQYNADLLKERKYPNWENKNSKWVECQEFMNQLIDKTKTPLKKEFKWGSVIYTYNGKNVIGWRGFKNFFSLWFNNGVFLEDKLKVLVTASEGKTKSLRQWRFTDVKDMNEKDILAYIEESVQTIKDGKELKKTKAPIKQVDGILKEYLERDKKFMDSFYALTPGKQKEYAEYIEDAKQDKTKHTRVEKIIPLVLSGTGLYDKYKR